MSENMVVMVFTDLVNSTAIIKQLYHGDTIARDRTYHETILKPHRQRVENTIGKYGGRKVDTQGDSYFLVFTNPIEAVRWAVEIQTSHSSDPIITPLGSLLVRIGMHVGSPLSQDDNLVGYDIHYASRVGALATGGQILLSEAMAALVRAASINNCRLHYHGERDLKDIGKESIFEFLYAEKQPQPLKEGIKVTLDTNREISEEDTKSVTLLREQHDGTLIDSSGELGNIPKPIKENRPQKFIIVKVVPLLLVLLPTLVGITKIDSSFIPGLCNLLGKCVQANENSNRTFSCGRYQKSYATNVYNRQSGEYIPFINWGSGYLSQSRCQTVSDRLESEYKNDRLNYITSGRMNGQKVICTATTKGGSCRGLLFTLRPQDDADEVLGQIFEIRMLGSNRPIEQSSGLVDNAKEIAVKIILELPVSTKSEVREIKIAIVGSGIIVNKEKSTKTYTVLLSKQIAVDANTNKVITFDGKEHTITFVSELGKGIDIQLLQFHSDRDYPIAKFGNSDPN
ncbi:COP23 domain-containing protein [Floridanema aerugineum]|uniref:COP23 domain-containing protein n=1 Tax=Floridaenema aerugineum BLCC-F46 TaxID=3153654 RepID=A0ABV4XB86_9CYAN